MNILKNVFSYIAKSGAKVAILAYKKNANLKYC